MCGIVGIIDQNGRITPEFRKTSVTAMSEAIRHRGPDEKGFYHDAYCTLGMQRLSIIDLSNGQQPIFNESGSIGVFFNGEIYNYRELRADLKGKGHRFQTDSDTEVLVHLYEEYGEDMLPKLRGMFAFCIFDKANRSWFLARDRFGEKPLFYHFSQGVFTFSSEIKSLLAQSEIPRILNREALPYYFRTSLLPEPLTFFKDIFTLPAGHFIKLRQGGEPEVKAYFKIEYSVNQDLKTEADAMAFIRPVLETAVKRQTVSDVPIGAFLSGGIDSSAIVALLQKNSGRAINTFTARFEEQAYDESKIAEKVAAHCGTNHHEVIIPNYDFTEDIFWTVIDRVGQPFRDSSAIPSYLLTREIGKEVKVALSGDGGDELFGGYDLFQWYLRIMKFKKVPAFIRKTGVSVLDAAMQTAVFEDSGKLRRVRRGLMTSLQAEDDIPLELNGFFSEKEIQKMMKSSGKPALNLLQSYPPEIRAGSDLRKIMYYRTKHTLPGNMLVKIDRMSMANSLEVRAPFLDPDLFAVAAQLPDEFLIKNGKGKHLIRELMKKELPPEVFDHPKSGFSIPLHKYQNEVYRKLAQRLLFEENPLPGLFDPDYLKLIYKQGIAGAKGQSVFQTAHKLWMFMQLFGWMKRFDVQDEG